LEAGLSLGFLDTAWVLVDAKEMPEQETLFVRQSVVEAFFQLQGIGVEGKVRWKGLVVKVFTFSQLRNQYRAMPTNSNCTFSSKVEAATKTAASS